MLTPYEKLVLRLLTFIAGQLAIQTVYMPEAAGARAVTTEKYTELCNQVKELVTQ